MLPCPCQSLGLGWPGCRRGGKRTKALGPPIQTLRTLPEIEPTDSCFLHLQSHDESSLTVRKRLDNDAAAADPSRRRRQSTGLPAVAIMGFYDVPNRSGPLVGSCLALLSIVVITILLRIYTRIFMIKNFGPDDWLMLAATVCPVHSDALAPRAARS